MDLYTQTSYLEPTPPFDFMKSLSFLNNFPPSQGGQKIGRKILSRALSIEGEIVVFRVSSVGTVEEPKLMYTLYAKHPISEYTKGLTVDRINFFLSLAEDLKPFYRIASEDPHFKPIVKRLYGYHQVKYLTPFENACWAILTQYNTIEIARKMKMSLIYEFGKSLTINGIVYRAFPEAEQMAILSQKEIGSTIRHNRKADYLLGTAKAFSRINERFLRTAEHDDVESWLKEIKGIGDWSATLILRRGLGRMDFVSPTDRWLPQIAARHYGRQNIEDPDSMQDILSQYNGWQGYWAHYLRVA